MKKSWGLTFQSQGQAPVQEDHLVLDFDHQLMMVADGFGGRSGKDAARLACETARDFLTNQMGDVEATMPFEKRRFRTLSENILANAMAIANDRVCKNFKNHGIGQKGGASLTAAILSDNIITIGWSGNCRAEIIREGALQSLAQPESYQQEFDRSPGRASDPYRDFPVRAIGLSTDFEPSLTQFRAERGDWLVLRSRGADPDIIESIADLQAGDKDSTKQVDQIRSLLNSRQYIDNSSIVLAFL